MTGPELSNYMTLLNKLHARMGSQVDAEPQPESCGTSPKIKRIDAAGCSRTTCAPNQLEVAIFRTRKIAFSTKYLYIKAEDHSLRLNITFWGFSGSFYFTNQRQK